ncbi:cupredoxin domain-containing protein [Azohydromonas lata]|uniref:Cupredoxin family copper-binding protein n=1 Tax=Azohydromonas lata TaxID=45677 RepID=A0ABU5IHF4_9BURK|nr:cupredoxin family copper-binding protein [Azohydromonas lata]MDZ5458579.1 cupredoxin family copper-binding protein [Azohydromonas lata]
MAERRRPGPAAVALAALGAAWPALAPAAQHTVRIEDMRFSPAALAVHPGDRVTWVNHDLVPHTVTGGGGPLDSGLVAAGASWTATVAAPAGTLRYRCTLHPAMTATLTVEDKP